MARLIVEAIAEDRAAAPGNRLVNHVAVSVTDANGTPVSGLTPSNFQVQTILEAPGGTRVNTEAGGEAPGFQGFYLLRVFPIQTDQVTALWKAGTYIFAVVVTRGPDRGQTLTSVVMD